MPTSRLQAGEPADPPSPAQPRAEAEYVRAPTRTGHRKRRHAAGPSTSPTSRRRRAAPRRVALDGAAARRPGRGALRPADPARPPGATGAGGPRLAAGCRAAALLRRPGPFRALGRAAAQGGAVVRLLP